MSTQTAFSQPLGSVSGKGPVGPSWSKLGPGSSFIPHLQGVSEGLCSATHPLVHNTPEPRPDLFYVPVALASVETNAV
jgi:hypothetical protein